MKVFRPAFEHAQPYLPRGSYGDRLCPGKRKYPIKSPVRDRADFHVGAYVIECLTYADLYDKMDDAGEKCDGFFAKHLV